jgi:hypothetical protein
MELGSVPGISQRDTLLPVAIEEPPLELCIVWHPEQSPTPPSWNGYADLFVRRRHSATIARGNNLCLATGEIIIPVIMIIKQPTHARHKSSMPAAALRGVPVAKSKNGPVERPP